MLTLAIETSCDETAASVVNAPARKILSNIIHSQQEHLEYGGVVPEIAARAHAERLPAIVEQALKEANVQLSDINLFAATTGPGLLGGLLVGSSFAKSLALSTGKPFIPVNHLEGHALSPHLTENIEFPYLLLLVSGGHCQFVMVKNVGEYEELGSTLDDAIGECFDKSAKMLGLPYPGGAHIEKLAKDGDSSAVLLPLPKDDNSLDFSFSGLKTAVRNVIQSGNHKNADIAAALQNTIAEIVVKKVEIALSKTQAKTFVIAGGVAANSEIRSRLQSLCNEKGVTFAAPPLTLCTDNAAMIAYAAGLRHHNNIAAANLAAKVVPRWPLSQSMR